MISGMDYFHEAIIIAADTEYEASIYAYTNDAVKLLKFQAFICEEDALSKKLYYDISVPLGICTYLEPEDKTYIDNIRKLKKAVNDMEMTEAYFDAYYASLRLADEYLQNIF